MNILRLTNSDQRFSDSVSSILHTDLPQTNRQHKKHCG